MFRPLFLASLVLGTTAAGAAEPPKESFTHTIQAETPYYTSGPQQGRPPDGTLPTGTKVKLLREAGSYSQVQAESGVTAYVAGETLQEIGGVKITDDVRAVARSNNEFAFDLYRRLRDQEGNLFFSPASIETALAMTYAGAEGETERQMAKVLHFDLDEQRLHDAFGTLSEILNARERGYRLNMANRLWGQAGFEFRQDYLSLTRQRYGAELAQVDFVRQAEQARQTINAWVEEQTNGKIVDLIPSEALGPLTRLVLTNAIYFKGTWAKEFSKKATQEAPFHLSEKRQVQAALMSQKGNFRYAEADGVQLLELPYAGDDLSMLVLLPKKIEGLADLEPNLTAENLSRWSEGLRKREVQLFLPRFKLTSQFRLGEVLAAMGMKQAFGPAADFSGMSPSDDLMISEVVHKAFVDVNEEGTEAAAATGVIVRVTAALPHEPVVFRADHPFVFAIRDNRSGAILFLGRVSEPGGAG
jgi:serpin B